MQDRRSQHVFFHLLMLANGHLRFWGHEEDTVLTFKMLTVQLETRCVTFALGTQNMVLVFLDSPMLITVLRGKVPNT
jgi:hypothetical protein